MALVLNTTCGRLYDPFAVSRCRSTRIRHCDERPIDYESVTGLGILYFAAITCLTAVLSADDRALPHHVSEGFSTVRLGLASVLGGPGSALKMQDPWHGLGYYDSVL